MNILRSSLKDWFYGVGVGGITGGTCGFGSGIICTYPNLWSEQKFQRNLALNRIESFTAIGTIFGSTIVSTTINPFISGCVFLVSTIPLYLKAKLR